MKKRIGTKLYDTEKAIPVLPEQGLYRQQKNRTFFFFDGETITPIEFDEAKAIIEEAGDPELLQFLQVKPNNRGCAGLMVSIDKYNKLSAYAAYVGKPLKAIVEEYIDSLSIDEGKGEIMTEAEYRKKTERFGELFDKWFCQAPIISAKEMVEMCQLRDELCAYEEHRDTLAAIRAGEISPHS